MTINYDKEGGDYAHARIPGEDDIFVPPTSSMPTASMVSSSSSYSPFDPMARPPSNSNTNNRMSLVGDDTSVMMLPSPTSTPPNYNTSTYEYATASTPSNQSFSGSNFAHTTDRPSSLPVVASASTSNNEGTMVISAAAADPNRVSTTTSSYAIAAPSNSELTMAMAGESDAAKKKRRRRRRRARMAAGSISGVLVGGVILGPLGAIVGGFSAGAATRAISKRREKRKDQRVADQYTSAIPIPAQTGEAV
jgi:hypothetical protein